MLACGAEQKNTVCLTKGNQAFLSQHIGDLENLRAMISLNLTITHLQRILDIQPEITRLRPASRLPEHPLCAGAERKAKSFRSSIIMPTW